MTRYRTLGVIGALALAATTVVVAGQGPAPAPSAGGQSRALEPPPPNDPSLRVLIVAENPSIDHRKQPQQGMGGPPPETNANFWRVSWSPVGPGVACFITVNQPTPGATKIVITDNPKLADYIAKEVLARLIPTFNTPAYTVIPGTITQTTDGTNSRTETCKGGSYTVDLKWFGGLSEPNWIDFPFARQNGVVMTLLGVNPKSAEITINGKRAPGDVASGFLALNETWRVKK